MRYHRYIGVVVSLLLIAAILLVFTDPWSILRKEDRQITLQDPGKIDRILLTGPFDSTLLVRKGDAWFLPGEEKVNPVTVGNLLYAAERLQINAINKDVRQWSNGMSTSVRFYNGDQTVLGLEMKSRGDLLLVRPLGGDRIFSVSLPGYPDLDLDRLFSSAANHYREHLLIDLLPSDILHIEVERKGEQPFRFTMNETGEISCMLPRLDSTLSNEILDDLAIRLLFSYFTSIRYEEVAGSIPDQNILDERFLARLHVESRQGKKHSLRVYSLPDDSGSGPHMFRALVIHNDDPAALVVNYIYLDVLMRDLSHYFAGSG